MTPSQPDTPSKRMSPGDIAIGQHITVLEWEPIIHEPTEFGALLTGVTTTTVTRDNSWKGDILKVVAVDLPFILVEEVDGYLSRPIKLDTRRVSLMELSAAYVAAASKKVER